MKKAWTDCYIGDEKLAQRVMEEAARRGLSKSAYVELVLRLAVGEGSDGGTIVLSGVNHRGGRYETTD